MQHEHHQHQPSTTTKPTTGAKRIRKASKGTQVPQAVPVTTKARHTRQPATNESDRPAYADLSFVRGKPTRYGWDHTDLFAVPDEESSDGRMTGLRAFQELQQLVKAQPKERDFMFAHYIKWTLQEAVKARESAVLGGKSKAGAADAFIECATQFMLGMLRSNDGQWMADRIARQQVSTDQIKDYLAKQKAQQRAAFIARMQAARAAKRAAREALASTNGHHENTVVTEAVGEVSA